ncbi:hypothetical protein [Stenotrophomonas nitritireducens]|uniref:hypothetical protein n=1 Tax=Stenotrophomonas nitritireducens TaxID=83617 RepID=UPI003D96966F
MKRNRKHPSVPPRRQRGVATLLIVLVVGLAVSVTVAATVYSLRGTQAKQLTTHSATAAQAAAWRGVEALRQYLLQLDKTQLAGLSGEVTGMGALGVRSASIVGVAASGLDRYRVNATVTGEAGVGSALTTATVEVVYDVGPGSGTPGVPPVCASMPTAPMVFNGNLDYTGGSLDVVNAVDYENIVVAGNLSISSGSAAKVSGCIKGNVNLSGGGLKENGHLYSEGGITIKSMTPPNGTTLWARQISLDGSSSSARFVALKAGAYSVALDVAGVTVGTANIGGSLIPSTVSGGIPWVNGTVLPSVAAATPVLVTLSDGSTFLLDLKEILVDTSTGVVSGAPAASERLGGTSDMPDSFTFRSDAIHGGEVSTQGLARTGLVWGHAVKVGLNGTSVTGSLDIGQLYANGNLDIGSGSVDKLVGGGKLSARGPGNTWSTTNFPAVASGTIAGKIYWGSADTELVASAPNYANIVSRMKVVPSVANTSPGLPGIPYCDARVKAVDADNYKGAANYVFESANGVPQLTIQNVRRADGTSIDGVYPLKSPSSAQLAILRELMSCDYGNDKGCQNIRQADGSWLLHGVGKMPPGVLWFDASTRVDGTSVNLLNSIVVKGRDCASGTSDCKGNITFTSAGHESLIAPNFAGAANVCGAAFYPGNLCASRTAFVTWEDADKKVYTGLPIGNSAVIAEGDAAIAGWKIDGSVLLGRTLSTSGAKVTIRGNLTVGSNRRSDTTISAGGIVVDVPSGDGSLSVVPICSVETSPIPAGPASASVLWSRYL